MERRFERALARLLEAYVDLDSAKLLHKKVESRSLFHSQQCVEKALKACLSIKYTGDIRVHEVGDIFKKDVLPQASEPIKGEFLEILTSIKWLEKRWVDTRYEIEIGRKIEIPSMVFKKEDATEGLTIAEKTLELSRRFLEDYFEITIPEESEKLKEMIVGELEK